MDFFVEQNPYIFLILTVLLGGGAAFMAGRNLAASWKSPWLLFAYMLIFTCGVRFLHFALFQNELFSLKYYISHGLIIQASAFFGYRLTMAKQMVEKYPFAFERTSLLGWRAKP